MQSHPKVSSYFPDWTGDSDWSSCSPPYEPITPDENFNDLNANTFVAAATPETQT